MDADTIIGLIVIIWILYIVSVFRSSDTSKENGIRVNIKVQKIDDLFDKLYIDTPQREGLLISFLFAYLIYSFSEVLSYNFSFEFFLFYILFAGAVLGKKFGTFGVFTGGIIFPLIFKNNFGATLAEILYYSTSLEGIETLMAYIFDYGNLGYLVVLAVSVTSIICTRFVGKQVDKHSRRGVMKHSFIMFFGWMILFIPLILISNGYLNVINPLSHLVIILLFGFISHKIGTGKTISSDFGKVSEIVEGTDVLPKMNEIAKNKVKNIDVENITKASEKKIDELKKLVPDINILNTQPEEEDVKYNTIIVEVLNSFKKEVLRDVKVIIEPVNGKPIERISDIDGKVIFGKVIEGVYNLKASLPGFEEFSKEITVDKNDRISIELKGKSNLTINVIDIANKNSISDATVELNGSKFITDERGLAVIPDLSFGSYNLNVTKNSFKQETLSVEVTGGQQEIKILLKPDIETNDEYIKHGEKIQTSLNEAMNKLSSACDMGIPGYYKGICLELIKFNESVASTPAYVYSEQSNEKIEALYTITGQICKEIEVVLTNSENITEYISIADKGIKTIPEISINPAEYDSMVQAYFENPADFLLNSKPGVLNKLQEIDAEITKNIQVFNINPVAHLWGISQIIVSGGKNEYEEGASLLLINILLDCTKNMFKNEEITKRLKI